MLVFPGRGIRFEALSHRLQYHVLGFLVIRGLTHDPEIQVLQKQFDVVQNQQLPYFVSNETYIDIGLFSCNLNKDKRKVFGPDQQGA